MGKLTQKEWDEQIARKEEIEAQNVSDPQFKTRPLGKAPRVGEGRPKRFNRREIETLAKKHAVNIYTRPSHKKLNYE